MQEEKTPYYAAQEPNDALDPWGVAANLEGFEEFGQDSSGEEPADVAASKRLAPWLAGVAVEETSSSSTPPGPEVDSSLIDWADPLAPEGLAAESENPAASADLFGDPVLYDTGVGDPWGVGTPPPGTVEQEEGRTFNPLFTAAWEDDLGVPSPGTAEQEGEPIFAPPWEDPNAQPSGTVEQEEAPAFAAPWEYDSTAPKLDTSTFAAGWVNVPDTPPEGHEDVPNAGFEEIPNPLDVWSEPSGMAGETTAAEDVWKDPAEGLIEDASEAFEDVSETTNDFFESIW
jgi:hypothetical protein